MVDSAGDHTAPYLEMVDECQKEFDDVNTLMVFVSECTHVLNLSEFLPEMDFEEIDLMDEQVEEFESYSDFKLYPQLD